ncbi:hypothetical protein [Chondrinema litorale]|uniref:hypothetical protein n=1 Tax=Chondrinema litorale TaxID=2994555 RepID=UPI00254366A8|nr:hypothetical protein [Chondrinema litorale]UZR99065.1 hypothetical protein OQ292_34920 [Chondrinema litorale]
MNTHKINWINAIIGGILGTLAFDLVGFAFTGQFWDIAGLLGEKTGLGFAYGLFGHYSNGILLAVLYAGIAPSLIGPNWLRTLVFVTAETIALVWFFMFPLLGGGIAGAEMSEIIPVLSMVRHWAYGIPLWYFVHQYHQQSLAVQ